MSITTYIQETRAEFKHVKWPTRAQAVSYTLLVIGISVLVSVFLFGFDLGFIKILGLLITR